MSSEELNRVRLDKWLWAARFFKTRALAAEAIAGGLVHVNGARVKPARIVHLHDEVMIQKGSYEFIVHVRAVSEHRGPAPEAQKLYEETVASRDKREAVSQQRRLSVDPAPSRKPDKRDRRQIMRFNETGR